MQLPAVAESNVCFAHRRLILLNNFSREKWDSIYSKLMQIFSLYTVLLLFVFSNNTMD